MSRPVATKPDVIMWLEAWFANQCDGDWEHSSGVRIESTDNPGWSVEIALAGTYLADRNFLKIEIERGTNDWLTMEVDTKLDLFRAACGPCNLSEVLIAFRHWAETNV